MLKSAADVVLDAMKEKLSDIYGDHKCEQVMKGTALIAKRTYGKKLLKELYLNKKPARIMINVKMKYF
jgi:hypothetical protein